MMCIIARSIFGINNRVTVGIKILHFVAAIFVTPISILVLPVKMVVLAGRNNHRNLAFALGAGCVVIRFLQCRNIGHHQFLHNGAAAT